MVFGALDYSVVASSSKILAMTLLRSLALLLVFVALAPTAQAGVKKIKAELLCGAVDDKNNVKAAVRNGAKTGKLDTRVACALHMVDPKEPAHMGTLKTIRHTIDGGKRADVAGTSHTTDFGPGSETADLNVFLLSGQPMDDGQLAFKPCEDFDIVGTISDDLGVYFTKTIKVVQGCPKPAPFKANLSCYYMLPNDKSVKLPLKGGERPNGVTSVSCELQTKDNRVSAEALVTELGVDWTQYNDDGSTRPIHVAGNASADQQMGALPLIRFSTDAKNWPNCQDVDLTFKIGDPDGIFYTQKIHTTITCGE